MKSKAENPENFLNKLKTHPLIGVYFAINHLKHLYRQGWLIQGISPEKCESVADHSFGVAILAMILADSEYPTLDQTKLLKMALIHDIGEIDPGDIIPHGNINNKEKYILERDTIIRVFGQLGFGEIYVDIWEEFETGKSPEAQFIRQIDKLEMVFQASIYEHLEYGSLEEFYYSVETTIVDQSLRLLLEELKNLRC
jgi:putative hydrolase of HD superfamily